MPNSIPPLSRGDVEFSALVERSGLSPAEVARLCHVTPRTVYRWARGEVPPNRLAVQELRRVGAFGPVSSASQQQLALPSFRYIDLFAGIGGFRKAFDAVGGKCVFTSEWDKFCRKTYLENHKSDHEVAGDIRAFTASADALERIPPHDVLVAGFPCQPFSIAGVSKKNALGRDHGFLCDTQGTLFFDLARILAHHHPAAFLLENVRNLASHDKGHTFRVIKRTLEDELGYTISYRIIDSRGWVPQGRKRILIAGFRTDTGFAMNDLPLPDLESGPRLGSILHNVEHDEPDEEGFTEGGTVLDKYTLTPRLWKYLQDYKRKHSAAGNGFGFGLCGPDDVARTLSARYYKDGSEILIRRGTGRARPRRLTPRECARLMGFDRPGEREFKIEVSDTQAYKQFGNSVVVPMAVAVAAHMKPHILSLLGNDQPHKTQRIAPLSSRTEPVPA